MKSMYFWLSCCLLAACASVSSVAPARAIAPFKKEFDKLYVKPAPGSDAEKSLAAAVKTAKCDVCHRGEKKKERNAYGDALDKLLDKKADAKDLVKIQSALKQVESEPSDPKDSASPTFGDLIKQGKLPVAK